MTEKLKVFRSALGAAAIVLLLVPAVANAAIIRFDQVNQGGTLTGTTATGFVGTNIIFEFITYQPTGSLVVTNKVWCGTPELLGGTAVDCLLNFDTNAGTFTVTSSANLLQLNGVTPIPGTTGVLLSGTFTSSGVDLTGLIFTATGFDTKNAALLEYFGVPAGTNFSFANTEIRLASGTVTQADITNTSIPEPGLLTLLGLGLVGAGRLTRRRA